MLRIFTSDETSEDACASLMSMAALLLVLNNGGREHMKWEVESA